MIMYFPGTTEINRECQETAERLFDCLEMIGDGYRASGMNAQVVDDVLQFEVSYDFFAIKPMEKADGMVALALATKTGKGS